MHKMYCFFLMISLTACVQKASIQIKTSIQNSKSIAHVNIPGTRLYLVPPPNFKIATTFIGLQKAENTLITVYDLVGGNINTNAATFTKEEFEKKGAKVLDFKDIKVEGYPAKFVLMQGDAMAKEYAIVFGDTTFTTMIMAVYPATDATSGKEILSALNTIYYDKNKKIDPFETAYFSVDDKKSKFKFFRYSANLYIYLINGIENKEDQDAPMVMILQIPKDNTMTVKSISEMMISKAQQYGFTNPEIRSTNTDKVNGYDSYQVEVTGNMQNKKCLFYYCIVAKNDKAVAIQGLAKNDMENNLQEFKQLANTIQVK
jgi:hypothetical protein